MASVGPSGAGGAPSPGGSPGAIKLPAITAGRGMGSPTLPPINTNLSRPSPSGAGRAKPEPDSPASAPGPGGDASRNAATGSGRRLSSELWAPPTPKSAETAFSAVQRKRRESGAADPAAMALDEDGEGGGDGAGEEGAAFDHGRKRGDQLTMAHRRLGSAQLRFERDDGIVVDPITLSWSMLSGPFTEYMVKCTALAAQGVTVSPEELQNFHHLFSGSVVYARRLRGGFKSSVWACASVNCFGHHCVPCIAKLAPAEELLIEYDRHCLLQQVLAGSVPTILGYCMKNTVGGMTMTNEKTGQSFETAYLSTLSSAHVLQLLDQLFGEVLSNLYERVKPMTVDLFMYYFARDDDSRALNSKFTQRKIRDALPIMFGVEAEVAPKLRKLMEEESGESQTLYERNVTNFGPVCFAGSRDALQVKPLSMDIQVLPIIDTLFEQARADSRHWMRGKRPVDHSFVHGDLNARNILVKGTDKIILIDFDHVHHGHRLRDFAKLQNEILFTLTPLDSDVELAQALDLMVVLLSPPSLYVVPQAPASLKLPKLVRAYKVVRRIRYWMSKLNLAHSALVEWYAAQLHYAVKSLYYVDISETNRKWALAMACWLAHLLKHPGAVHDLGVGTAAMALRTPVSRNHTTTLLGGLVGGKGGGGGGGANGANGANGGGKSAIKPIAEEEEQSAVPQHMLKYLFYTLQRDTSGFVRKQDLVSAVARLPSNVIGGVKVEGDTVPRWARRVHNGSFDFKQFEAFMDVEQINSADMLAALVYELAPHAYEGESLFRQWFHSSSNFNFVEEERRLRRVLLVTHLLPPLALPVLAARALYSLLKNPSQLETSVGSVGSKYHDRNDNQREHMTWAGLVAEAELFPGFFLLLSALFTMAGLPLVYGDEWHIDYSEQLQAVIVYVVGVVVLYTCRATKLPSTEEMTHELGGLSSVRVLLPYDATSVSTCADLGEALRAYWYDQQQAMSPLHAHLVRLVGQGPIAARILRSGLVRCISPLHLVTIAMLCVVHGLFWVFHRMAMGQRDHEESPAATGVAMAAAVSMCMSAVFMLSLTWVRNELVRVLLLLQGFTALTSLKASSILNLPYLPLDQPENVHAWVTLRKVLVLQYVSDRAAALSTLLLRAHGAAILCLTVPLCGYAMWLLAFRNGDGTVEATGSGLYGGSLLLGAFDMAVVYPQMLQAMSVKASISAMLADARPQLLQVMYDLNLRSLRVSHIHRFAPEECAFFAQCARLLNRTVTLTSHEGAGLHSGLDVTWTVAMRARIAAALVLTLLAFVCVGQYRYA